MKNGQWYTAHLQDSNSPRDARGLEHASPALPHEIDVRGEPSDAGPQAFVVWQILELLRAAMRTIATSEEAALVRGWCAQALEDFDLGTREEVPLVPEGGGQVGALADGQDGKGRHKANASKCALTVRQVEILRRLRDGERPKEIAYDLHLAERTARSHIRDAIERLGVSGWLAAVREAERRGLLGPRF